MFVACAAMRLARFNILSASGGDKRYYVGMPSPAAAAVPAATVFMYPYGLYDYRAALPEKSNGQTVYSPEVLSLLDVLAKDIKSRNEKTYSAPLAAHLYAKESVEMPNGGVGRDYPRLKYGGAHLANPQGRNGDYREQQVDHCVRPENNRHTIHGDNSYSLTRGSTMVYEMSVRTRPAI
jgi:hypothetical protein